MCGLWWSLSSKEVGSAVIPVALLELQGSRRLCAALRKCQLSGQKANNGWSVSFSHHRTKKLQDVNLQSKRLFWPEQQRWVQLRVTAKVCPAVDGHLSLRDMRGAPVYLKQLLWQGSPCQARFMGLPGNAQANIYRASQLSHDVIEPCRP